MPGTTCGMARTKSAINNSQASGYVRGQGVARVIGTPQQPNLHMAGGSDLQYGASHWRHTGEREMSTDERESVFAAKNVFTT